MLRRRVVGANDFFILSAISNGFSKNNALLKEVFSDQLSFYRYLDNALQRLKRKGLIFFEKGNWHLVKQQKTLEEKSGF